MSTPTTRSPDGDAPPVRHLRVGLLIAPRSVRVVSVAVAPGVPARLLASGHPWLAVVSVGDRVVQLSRFQDPFTQRSTRTRDGGDHHLSTHDEGVVVVAVPFGSLTDLSRSRIDVLDLRRRPGLVSADDLVEEFRRCGGPGGGNRSLGYAEITASRDWPKVAAVLGISAPPGAFEIYLDKGAEYRWRLRSAGGAIVAVSGQGFARRSDCEAEVIWVRRHAAGSPTRAFDGPEPQ